MLAIAVSPCVRSSHHPSLRPFVRSFSHLSFYSSNPSMYPLSCLLISHVPLLVAYTSITVFVCPFVNIFNLPMRLFTLFCKLKVITLFVINEISRQFEEEQHSSVKAEATAERKSYTCCECKANTYSEKTKTNGYSRVGLKFILFHLLCKVL